MSAYTDNYYTSPDGLKLFYRDYAHPSTRAPTVLCMHGLTRNSADFHALALNLSDRFHVISVDQRGRGLSAYDPNAENYRPEIYCQDMFALVEHAKLTNIIAVGTSMGGLMIMIMALMQPDFFTAVVINDIGPVVEQAGLERIKGYVGGGGPFANWADVENAIKAQGPDVFPKYTDKDWQKFARRTAKQLPDGTIDFAYDPELAKALQDANSNAVPTDLWPIFSALSDTPTLVIRGEISDILSSETVTKMCAQNHQCTSVEIPDIGHAPMLDEPLSLSAIDAFLKPFLKE